MSIVGKRNKFLIIVQMIASLVVTLALAMLSLGNLVSISTEAGDRREDYTDDFYMLFSDTNGDELDTSVDVGFLTLWEDAFHLIHPSSALWHPNSSVYNVSSTAVDASEGLLYLTHLASYALSEALYEGVVFLCLLLYLLTLPLYIFICFVKGLIEVLANRHQLRTAYMKAIQCMNRAWGSVLLLFMLLFFSTGCIISIHAKYLLWTIWGTLIFFFVISHVKHHTSAERGFLAFSQTFSFISCAACFFSMWQAQKAGLIETLYHNFYSMDGVHLFINLWEGRSDTSGILVFIISTLIILGLCGVFFLLFLGITRWGCLFNPSENRKNDHLFKYGIFFAMAFLLYTFLINASGEYAVHLTDEAFFSYILALVFAGVALLSEILHSVLGYFIIRIDMVTRLEVLSGYAKYRLTMDESTYKSAVSSSNSDDTILPQD